MPGFTYKIKDRKWTCCDCGSPITVVDQGIKMICSECGNGLFEMLEKDENEAERPETENWKARSCKPHTR